MAWQLCCSNVAGDALPLLVHEYHLQCHNGVSGGSLQLAAGFCIGAPGDVVPGSSRFLLWACGRELRTIVSHNDIWYAKPREDCFELLYEGP